MFKEDTIAAIATPSGYGGVSIIRISGSNAFNVINKIFKMKNKSIFDVDKNTINYGHIIDSKTNEVVDEVLVSKMCAPHSFTAEDVIEINCHGGMSVTSRVLALVLENGARLAEAGEFTKRAFLNGRIDLVQAEAISDLIMAKTNSFAKSAMNSLKGDLSEKIDEIKADITNMLARLEVTIQYPEYDEEDLTDNEIVDLIEKMSFKLKKIISTFEKGEILKEGIKVAIIGKPNVGKSQLLNALINENKAIVTDEAGTTRDIVDEVVNIKGVPVKFIDTAGIRNADNKVEQIGIDKSISMLEDSNIILFCIDSSRALDSEDIEIIKMLPENKDIIVVLNKMDLDVNNETINAFENYKTIEISALKQEGIEKIEKAIYDIAKVNDNDEVGEILVSNVRHKNLLLGAKEDFDHAIEMVHSGLEVDLVEIDINAALSKLGEITGETTSEDIIDEIFKNFCLGK
ncbi:tRNA uridine-5-carboxymethylaminomethyl(34) synthesis GTPase MnmE [Anaerofustis sp. NSJ-163]|uniref:tRNA uridine-5-carboxymethylaminomethyl(34) synthesis GTPase MnmE n=1 Tax=Anaerofustis sp. NSJ-163 TaxID=2944391 RepID=UPI00209C5E94|nr:tRNA uridine-5-carboxymethylaminomethyl(34) synthesis GTPase MnmE [Anaerofustis sp. NSJ-163]MCO8193390.1 tRNA uridine-5-carboxymethylaminomethyl(34) synthesis GTPase MnmE [Anaerofustis sp. NSJ-163]